MKVGGFVLDEAHYIGRLQLIEPAALVVGKTLGKKALDELRVVEHRRRCESALSLQVQPEILLQPLCR